MHVYWSTLGLWRGNSITVSIGSCKAMFSSLWSMSGQGQFKGGQISNLINVKKKGIYQMQFELRNPMVPFILLWQRPKHAQICI